MLQNSIVSEKVSEMGEVHSQIHVAVYSGVPVWVGAHILVSTVMRRKRYGERKTKQRAVESAMDVPYKPM
jgi:hypothetical protein